MDAAPDVQPQQPTQEQSSLAATGLPQAPPPEHVQQEQENNEAFHSSTMGSVAHGILAALGGSTETTYQVDPKTGAIATQTAPAKPGSQWKTILAGALSGLAAGAGVHGPGGAGEAAAKGFAAGNQMVQQKQEQAKQQAQFQSHEIQQARMNQASYLMSEQQLAAGTLALANKKVQVAQNFAAIQNQMQSLIKSAPNAKFRGFFNTEQAVAQASLKDPQLAKEHVDGSQMINPIYGTDENGNPTVEGFELWGVPKDWLNSPTDHDVKYSEESVDPATGKIVYETHSIPKGTISNKDAKNYVNKNISGAITPASEESNETKQEVQSMKSQTAVLQQQMKDTLKQVEDAKTNQPLDPNTMSNMGKFIGNYQLDPKTVRYVFNKHPEIVNSLPNGYDEKTYDAAYKALDSFVNGKNAVTLQAADTSMKHLYSLKQLVSRLPVNSDINVLNRAIAQGAREFGMPDITNVETLAGAVSGEVGKSITGGVADKDTLEQIRSHLIPGKVNVRQIQGAINTLAHANIEKADSMAQTLDAAVPNIATNPHAPKLSPGAVAALKAFGFQDPFDFSNRQASSLSNAGFQQPQSNSPAVGTVQQGYKFLGGNPGDPKSWQKVQ